MQGHVVMKSHSRCTDYRLSPLLLGPQSLINQTSLMNFHFKIPFLLFSFINYCWSPGPTLVLHVNSNKVWFLIPSFFWCLFLLWGFVRNGAPLKLPKICGYKTKIFLWFKSVEVHSYWLLFFFSFSFIDNLKLSRQHIFPCNSPFDLWYVYYCLFISRCCQGHFWFWQVHISITWTVYNNVSKTDCSMTS